MFIYLLIANFLIAALVSLIVIGIFSKSINSILQRIISDPINKSWSKYIKFSGCVVGISSGVRVYEIEKYISPQYPQADNPVILTLTQERWILEVYRTIIETLQGLAWMMFVFFSFALIAYVLVRISEMKHQKH